LILYYIKEKLLQKRKKKLDTLSYKKNAVDSLRKKMSRRESIDEKKGKKFIKNDKI